MTVPSIPWLLARPRRLAALTRSRRPAPLERRTYPDVFFADPAAVEDDSRRMLRRS
ncbi:MAG TPA: hypothetical protein VH594_02290 [Trebonia sp.]|jgi:hypothetical protein